MTKQDSTQEFWKDLVTTLEQPLYQFTYVHAPRPLPEIGTHIYQAKLGNPPILTNVSFDFPNGNKIECVAHFGPLQTEVCRWNYEISLAPGSGGYGAVRSGSFAHMDVQQTANNIMGKMKDAARPYGARV